MDRESMVFYRSFADTIMKVKEQIGADAAMELYEAIMYYGLDGEVNELSPLVDAFFTLIKPQLDANIRKYLNGKKGAKHGAKGGRPKTPRKPQENPKETPNVNDNVNVNVNLNENKNEDVQKNLSFSYEKIENSHLLKLDDYESKAATIVSSYFLSLNFEYEDFAVFNSRNIKRGRENDNDTAMKKLNKAFLTYIYTCNINNIQKVQILIKSIINVPNIYRYSHVINGAIEQIHLATQNKYKRFYLENIKQ